ncbi:MAG: ankyrin repeat domain-containing protein [Akkermansia sp.]|nr:ankyrin repeat domain-containing protein [Akkermansia sp.]
MKVSRLLLSLVLPLGMVSCQTSLQKAAANGQTKRVEQIIAKGVNVNTVDSEGWLALSRAAANDRVEVIQTLLNHGANPNMANSNGWTPLHAAAREGRSAAASALLARGAQVNIVTPDGWTPLMFAAVNGYTGVARVLLDHGAGVNIKSNNGDAALDLAADKNREAMVQLLIQRGANVNSTDRKGKTAADYTESNNILIMLKNAGAKIPARDLAPSSIAWKVVELQGVLNRSVVSFSIGSRLEPGASSYNWNGVTDAYTNYFEYTKTGAQTATIRTGHGAQYSTTLSLVFDTPSSGRIVKEVYEGMNPTTFNEETKVRRPNTPFRIR